jgi:hypothetical protein
MSVRAMLKLFVLALVVFAISFGLRRALFWNVMPVSWGQDPQSLWALGAAFLLDSVENMAAVVAALALVAASVFRWRGRRIVPTPALRDGEWIH